MNRKKIKITWYTGAAIVIANMIGTGAFTSLGFQLPDIKHTGSILLLWVLGGLVALAGAFSYAEIGTLLKESGGEYTFLSRIYHPLLGYLSGWISLTVGFAAPIALASIAFSEYFLQTGLGSPAYLSVGIIIALSLIHSFNLSTSASFQNISTLFKIGFIILFLVLGCCLAPQEPSAVSFSTNFRGELLSPAFAISLIFVSYAYTGWNAATYITEEFGNIQRDLPRALIVATVVVTVLYTVLQYVFLRNAAYGELVNQVDVGAIAANNMFGPNISRFFNGAISLLLVSSISAMIWVGPRVSSKMAEEYKIWQFLKEDLRTVPVKAIWFQAVISILLIVSGTFEQILIYCGVLLNLSSALVVSSVFVVRRNYPKAGIYRSPLFPLMQIFFIIMSVWMIAFAVIDKPVEIVIGLANILLGLITFAINRLIK